jgi:hypothetical protein
MKRVLIYVNGGVADYVADDGVEVVIYDFDSGADATPVPAEFSDLAEIVEVPYATA